MLVWEEPAEVPVAWDDPGPKPRRKVKKKKYRTVMAHGYEQSVLCDDDGDAPSRPDPPSLDAPIVIKQKALIIDTKSGYEAFMRVTRDQDPINPNNYFIPAGERIPGPCVQAGQEPE